MANLSNINNKFIVEDSGDVGIGVTTATTKLHIGGTAPGDSIIRQDSTVSGTNWEIGERAAGKWQIFEDDGDTIVATFMSTGNVGIGTDSPDTLLHIYNPDTNWGAYSIITLGTDVEGTSQAQLKYYRGASASTESFQLSVRGTTALTALYNGNVGIGTTTPTQSKLVVIDSADTSKQIVFSDNATYYGSISHNAGTGLNEYRTEASGGHAFYKGTETTPKVIINSSGNVGIGETDPSGYWGQANNIVIDTSGNGGITIKSTSAGNGRLVFTDTKSTTAGNTDGGMIAYNHTDDEMRFQTNGGQRIVIDSSGNVGIGTTSPDLGGIAGTRVLTIASPTAERWGILELAGNRTWGGNQVGELKFISTDSTNNGTLVSLTAINDPSATGTGGSLKFSTRPSGGSLTERMRIDSSGNVTINEYLRVGPNINNANTFDYSLQTRQLLVAGFSGTGESNIYIHRDDQTISGGNVIGNLNFSGQDGASNIGAQISAVAGGSWGTTSAGSNIIFSTCANSSNTLTERMRIDSSGRVGIAINPSAWGVDALQVGQASISQDVNSVYIGANTYNSSAGWKRINAQLAGYIRMGTNDGIWSFSNGVTGAADSVITWNERMRIDSAGNVGIGETSPASKLTVRKDAVGGRGGEISIVNYSSVTVGNEAALNFGLESSTYNADNGNAQIKARVNALNAATDMIFSTWNGGAFGERMSIGSTGRINMLGLDGKTQTNSDVRFSTATGELYYQTSSRRYKTDIVNLENCLDKVNALRPVRFKDIKTEEDACGLIAEETFEIIPDVVFTKEIEGFDEPQIEGLNYSDLVPFLIKSIQELKAEIELLKSK